MRLKVEEIEAGRNGRVWLVDGRAGGVEMDLSNRSQHIAGMNLQEGDFVEVTIKKIKPAKKKK